MRGAQERGAAAVHAVGGGVFVDHLLEVCGVPVQAGWADGWGEVADGDGPKAAFGGGSLARVVDDEGIDDRQARGECAGPAQGRKGGGLAGQPLQRAMGSEMDDRVPGAQREIEGDVGVTGRQVGVVVGRATVGFAAAVGLQRGSDAAEPEMAKGEMAVLHGRVGIRVPPGGRGGLLQRPRKGGEERGVAGQA